MERSRMSGCLASGFVELELQYIAHEVPLIREEEELSYLVFPFKGIQVDKLFI